MAARNLVYITEPELNQWPDYVDTGQFSADETLTYNLEAYWRYGSYWIGGEYTQTDVEAPDFGDPSFSGYHLTGSWIVSGEMRGYNHKTGLFSPIKVARSVYDDGWGSWETYLRWSSLDLTDESIEGGEIDILSVGLNWWLTDGFTVSVNYRYIELDRFGIDAKSSGLNLRVMVFLL